MPVIRVRVSEEQLRELLRYGSISQAVREGLKLYLNRRKSEKALSRLQRLQSKNKPRTTAKKEVRLIKEDRTR